MFMQGSARNILPNIRGEFKWEHVWGVLLILGDVTLYKLDPNADHFRFWKVGLFWICADLGDVISKIEIDLKHKCCPPAPPTHKCVRIGLAAVLIFWASLSAIVKGVVGLFLVLAIILAPV